MALGDPKIVVIISGWNFAEAKRQLRKPSEPKQDDGTLRAVRASMATIDDFCRVLRIDLF